MRIVGDHNLHWTGALLLVSLATSCSLNPRGELPSATEDDSDVEGAPGRTGTADDVADDDAESEGGGAPVGPGLGNPEPANDQAVDDPADSPAGDDVVDDPGDGDLDVLDPPSEPEGEGAGGAAAIDPTVDSEVDAGADGGVSPIADAGAFDGGGSLDAGSDETDGGE